MTLYCWARQNGATGLDRLIKIGRFYVMEINVEKTKNIRT